MKFILLAAVLTGLVACAPHVAYCNELHGLLAQAETGKDPQMLDTARQRALDLFFAGDGRDAALSVSDAAAAAAMLNNPRTQALGNQDTYERAIKRARENFANECGK